MSTIALKVTGTTASASEVKEVSGSYGVDTITVTSDWGSTLTLSVVLVACPHGIDPAKTANQIRRTEAVTSGSATISETSAAVLKNPGWDLWVGLMGEADGIQKTSTLVDVGQISAGADPDVGDGDIGQSKYEIVLDKIEAANTAIDNLNTNLDTKYSRAITNAATTGEAVDKPSMIFDKPSGAFKVYFPMASDESAGMITRAQYKQLMSGGSSARAISARAMGLHTVPDSDGALNFVRRCRQFTDVQWTPAVDLPRAMLNNSENAAYEGVFKAGKTYKGIPYSNTAVALTTHGQQYVGYEVPIESFITAVSDANSIISKESAFKAIGSTAVGATAYGCVCSSFASYAYGLDSVYTTQTITTVSGFSSVGVANTISADKLAIGQLLNISGYHSVMITDIIYDDDGAAEWIEVSEATDLTADNSALTDPPTGGMCMRRGFSLSEFRWYWSGFKVYNYSNIDNITYTKSSFVNVGGEMDCYRNTYMNLVPYAGNGYVFTAGSILSNKLLINNHTYGYIRVLKDDKVFDTIAISSTDTSVTVNFTAVGAYEAYLCNMSGNTVTDRSVWSCNWKVVS